VRALLGEVVLSDQQTVLVTGASSGFGLLTSVALAKAGLRVIATMRELKRSERLMQAARAAKVELELLRLDVTDEKSIAEAVTRAGRIDVLVNNAGYGLAGFFADYTMEELRQQFETNFFGVAALCKAVLPQMMQRRSGRIINISSLSGRVALPSVSAYCASKFALEGLSESMRHELKPFGVQVVLVEPGTFKTDAFDRNLTLSPNSDTPSSPYYAMGQRLIKQVTAQVARSKADPNAVARAIVRAATVKRPRLRYLVGADARALTMVKTLLPYAAIEMAVQKQIGAVDPPALGTSEPRQLAK
jgi:NAD(P)-dependent dehydrogenase (short-subunit alcohol dehydrogenase family)